MKKVLLLTLAAGLIFVCTTGCGTSYRMQQGAIAGAAFGAVVGHDIGEDTESTLIGAAVGGLTGAVIGDAVREYERNNSYQYYQKAPSQAPPRRY
jgi:uncharacterized protein YcfJ